jgi:hypothetical protein
MCYLLMIERRLKLNSDVVRTGGAKLRSVRATVDHSVVSEPFRLRLTYLSATFIYLTSTSAVASLNNNNGGVASPYDPCIFGVVPQHEVRTGSNTPMPEVGPPVSQPHERRSSQLHTKPIGSFRVSRLKMHDTIFSMVRTRQSQKD